MFGAEPPERSGVHGTGRVDDLTRPLYVLSVRPGRMRVTGSLPGIGARSRRPVSGGQLAFQGSAEAGSDPGRAQPGLEAFRLRADRRGRRGGSVLEQA